ncbi:hypothetical protein QUW15_01685 [Desulfovibrio piger]|nr:hypothetical protein [Desulfovibrio piger]
MENMAASLSFFSALVNCKRNLLQVIVSLVLYALASKKQYSFSISEVTTITNEFYAFEFPDAVLKRVCNKMVRDGLLSKDKNATYIINNGFHIDVDDTEKVFLKLHDVHNEICNKLYSYCKSIRKDVDKDEIVSCLFDFILFDTSQGKYSSIVSAFLISIEYDEKYINYLNSIRPALVIYKGICSNPIFNNQTTWNDELNLFLNTDVLFSAYGLNGAYQRKLFDDFYRMIKEINTTSLASKNKKVIRCYYFNKIKDEIDKFYYTAGQVVQGQITLDPSKKAMREIVKGCRTESDVIEKKSKFINFLDTMGIKCFNNDIDIANYVVESVEIKNILKTELQNNDIQFNEEEIDLVFYHLTNINALRKGNSACSFGKAKYFFVTDKFLTNYIASCEVIKFNAKDIPLSTSIDFLTSKLWFALGKCFSSEKDWAAFDIIINTKLAIESELNDAIEICFQNIKTKLKRGDISQEEACRFYMSLREKAVEPETISDNNINDIVNFCTINKIEALQNEQYTLKERLKKAEKDSNTLYKIYKDELFRNNNKKRYRCISMEFKILYYIVILATFIAISCLSELITFNTLHDENGAIKKEFIQFSTSGIISGVIANGLFLLFTVISRRKFISKIEKKISNIYKIKLQKKREFLKKRFNR